MRFVVLALALMGPQAGAIELACGVWPGEYGRATCYHPSADLPYSEIHIDAPGTYAATIGFASALTDITYFTGYKYSHFDVYNTDGILIDGNDGFSDYLVNLELPAGITGFSFQYTLPEIAHTTDDYHQLGRIDQIYSGTSSYFTLESTPRLPAFTFNVSQVAPVPEPASWALMIAGAGVIGFTARRRRSIARRAVQERHAGFRPDIRDRAGAVDDVPALHGRL